MGDSKVAGALMGGLLAVLVAGCAGQWVGQLKRTLREPGERLAAFPEEVAEEYGCQERRLPYLALEKNELNPSRLRPGGEFNHRIVYALCPERTTQAVRGTLVTRIRFRGRPIASDTVRDFELKPGRWIVDSFVKLPEDAEIGIYSLELLFESPSVHLERSATFGVDAPGRN